MRIGKITVCEENDGKFARIYFFHSKETVIDNLRERNSRPYNELKKLLPKVFKKANLPADTKVRWSQKAGCSCGCSPGFIADFRGHDVFVDLKK